MRLLALLALVLLPLSAFAQLVPPLGDSTMSTGVTVIHPAPGIDYYYDQRGNSSTVYETAPGLHWYSAQDQHGRITSQGFLFDPLPREKPLSVPEFIPPPRLPSK